MARIMSRSWTFPFVPYCKMPYVRWRTCTSSGRDDLRRSLPEVKGGDTDGFGGYVCACAIGKGDTSQLRKVREHIPNGWNTPGSDFGNAASGTMAEEFRQRIETGVEPEVVTYRTGISELLTELLF